MHKTSFSPEGNRAENNRIIPANPSFIQQMQQKIRPYLYYAILGLSSFGAGCSDCGGFFQGGYIRNSNRPDPFQEHTLKSENAAVKPKKGRYAVLLKELEILKNDVEEGRASACEVRNLSSRIATLEDEQQRVTLLSKLDQLIRTRFPDLYDDIVAAIFTPPKPIAEDALDNSLISDGEED